MDPAHREPHRHQEPVVAERQREFGHADSQQVRDAGLGAGEVDVAVLELPVALGRHAGIADRRRMARCNSKCLCHRIALRRHGLGAEILPIDVTVGVLGHIQRCVVRLQRKRVFQPVLLPRRAGGVDLVHQIVEPREPGRKHDLRAGGIGACQGQTGGQSRKRTSGIDEGTQRIREILAVDGSSGKERRP